MARDENEDESVTSAEDRRELERIAFAKPETSEDAAAAAEALRRLVAADAAAGQSDETTASPPPTVTPARAPRAIEEIVVDGDDAGADAHADDESTERPARRRRSLVPLIVLVGLVVGIGAGVLVSRASPEVFGVASATPSPTASVGANGSTAAQDATAAINAPQTSRDVFPDQGFATTLNLQKRSVHRILTSDDGYTLWIGRTPQDICLLLTKADDDGGNAIESGCSTAFAFDNGGLALAQGGMEFSWNGSTFSVGASRTR